MSVDYSFSCSRAAKSLMPYKVYEQLESKQPVRSTDKGFQSYTKHPIDVEGFVVLPTKYKDKCIDVKYYVVHIDQRPLLAGDPSEQLGLIQRVQKIDELDVYPELKKTTGTLPGKYSLKIDPTVSPVVHGPRRQPKALLMQIKDKLREMEENGYITRVKEPTDWVSSMVTVVKNGGIRICIDPRDLNRAIRREHYPIPTVEEVVASFPKAKVFTVLDAKSGFLQIPLDYESSLLTTFNTPQGRYRWLRLPFGVKSAPEIFQHIMDDMLHDIDGARAIMDDILIGGEDDNEHDIILEKVVRRATEWNLMFNFKKCQIKKRQVDYVGHTVSENGLEANKDKVRALMEMPTPQTKQEVRSFSGLVQYLSKFIPNLSTIDAPLREVMKQDVEFFWLEPQEASFEKLKMLCAEAPVLARYDVTKDVTIQCDASSYAVGGVLLQDGHSVAYTSRALTETEKRYAQIEKEALAILHYCKKFHFYIFGKPVLIESDHRPLQAIFAKPMQSASMRLQAMMLRLQPYDLHVTYRPGREIAIGDALSRANLPDKETEMDNILVNVIDFVAVAPTRYKQFQECTANELNELYQIILKGWPDTKLETPHSVRAYWNIRDELSVTDGIIMKGLRITVPPSMRQDMLKQIHESHLGITKCKQRAREALFWPSMCQQVEDLVSDCPECQTYQNRQGKEPLKPTKIPDLPWMEIACDIMEWHGEKYMVTVDYYSKFIEVDKVPTQSSACAISAIKSQICRHGIPEILRSDNGPQFASAEFTKFCQDYGICHVTSSPGYPQSNGEAERAVQTMKRLWSKCKDKYLALLDYRTTPLESCNLSPAQIAMSRRPRNKIPVARDLLRPIAYDGESIRQQLEEHKQKQLFYYNRNASVNLPPLLPGDPVRVQPAPGARQWLPATVVKRHDAPRSYVVEHQGKKYRRNRKHLRLSTYEGNKGRSIGDTTTRGDHPFQCRPPPTIVPPRNLPPQSFAKQPPPAQLSGPDRQCSPVKEAPPANKEPAGQDDVEGIQTRSGRVSRPPRRLLIEC